MTSAEIPTVRELLDLLEEERRKNKEKDAEIEALQELKKIWETKYYDLQRQVSEMWGGIHLKNVEAMNQLKGLINEKTENRELAESLIGIFNNLTSNLTGNKR